jgi:hypothetical protein
MTRKKTIAHMKSLQKRQMITKTRQSLILFPVNFSFDKGMEEDELEQELTELNKPMGNMFF